MKVSECKIIDLPKIAEPSGNLTFIESARHVPFQIAHVYYLYDVPGGAERGGHAHKVVEEFLVAIAGSFDVLLYDGREKGRFHLNRSFYGLFIPRMIWRELGISRRDLFAWSSRRIFMMKTTTIGITTRI